MKLFSFIALAFLFKISIAGENAPDIWTHLIPQIEYINGLLKNPFNFPAVTSLVERIKKPLKPPAANTTPATNTGDSSTKCPVTKENPTRPCPKNSIHCVKKYFQSRANCLSYICPVNSNTIQLENFKNYEPVVNATIVQNATLTGVGSGKIYDFIVDKTTNIVVLSIEYKNINIVGTADFTQYKSGREPKTVRADTTENYSTVIITTYFDDTENLNLENSYSVANITLPVFTIGPCLAQSKDPETIEFFKAFIENVNAVAQEAYQTRAPLIQSYFMSKNICNYIKK